MRKLHLHLFVLLLSIQLAFGQSNGINFQGIARTASGEPLVSQKITLRFAVIQSTESGTVEYQETKETTSNGQGMFSVVIGDGNFLTKTGNFSEINWKVSPKFLKVELDSQGGTNFVLMGTSRLQAVPFAYYANGVDAENVQGILTTAKGGTGVASIAALKGVLQLDQVSNTSDATKPLSTAAQSALATKVDKIEGKGLSSNDFTNLEKTKLAGISGTNTGDQDLSGFATIVDLATKVSINSLNNSLELKENLANKSSAVDLGGALPSDLLYPTQKAVKSYIASNISAGGVADGGITTIKLADGAVTDAKVTNGISKAKVGLENVDNTSDENKPISVAMQSALSAKANSSDVSSALANKVDKVQGKDLSTNDYTTAEKTKLASISGTNTGDQDLSGYATLTSLSTKANSSDVSSALANKVDKVQGKDLSTNDYTTAEKTKLASISGTNTGDQDLSGYATLTSLSTKANSSDVSSALANKVDKVQGKDLSTNDYTTAEKTKLASISGTNTGDQDLSGYATLTSLSAKANSTDVSSALANKVDKVQGKDLSTNDYTTAEKTKLASISGTNTGDQDLSGYATLTSLSAKANSSDVSSALANKVDKVQGKDLSTNDYTTAEKTKLASISGTNTGDQDLSGYATLTSLSTKANSSDVSSALANKVDKVQGKDLSTNDYTTAEKTKLASISGTNTGDQTNISGNAATATKLAFPRTINGISFDGSSDITITATANAETLAGTTLNGTITGSNLSSVGVLNNATVNGKVIVGATLETSTSAILEANSTSQGFLPPRMTLEQRIAITNPAQGLLIYCTNCGINGEPEYYNGSTWLNLAGNAVAKATPNISITVGTYTFNGGAQGPTIASNSGTSNAYTFSYVGTGSTTYSASALRPSNAGTYNVTVTLAASSDGNYNSATKTVAFTIAKAIPSVTPTIGTYNYNLTTPSAQGPSAATNSGTGTSYTYSYVGTGFTSYGPSSTKPTDGGTYTVVATVAASADGNYASASSSPTAFKISLNLSLGNSYGGGKVAYILQPGDVGYDPTQQHGLIVSGDLTSPSTDIIWGTEGLMVGAYEGAEFLDSGVESVTLGLGIGLSNAIINKEGTGSNFAAGLAKSYTGGGYTNWYLPSFIELYVIGRNKVYIGSINRAFYWSSTEGDDDNAWIMNFGSSGFPYEGAKGVAQAGVRAVRVF